MNTPRSCEAFCTSLEVVGVAKLGKMIRTLRRQGVKRVVMAGKVTKNVIYTPWRFVQLCPDLRTLQWWYRRSRADNRDDSLLLSVIDEFERDGMTFASALDFCPELLVKEGILTRRAPTPAERKRHRVRLGDGQGDGPAGRRPVGGRQGKGDSGRRGHRGDGPLHRPRRPALPGRGLDPGQGCQAAARHAVRRAHDRRDDDREPASGQAPACWRSRPARRS